MFRRSSAVEQLTVNQLVVGSIPTAGATFTNGVNGLNHRRRLCIERPKFIKGYTHLTEECLPLVFHHIADTEHLIFKQFFHLRNHMLIAVIVI